MSPQLAEPGSDGLFALFDTELGTCAIGWGDQGIRRLLLPEPSRARTLARIREIRGDTGAIVESAPSSPVRAVIQVLTEQLDGVASDDMDARLRTAQLDLSGVSPFVCRVYEELRRVPPGQTITYGELAARAGSAKAARAVGRAMAKNPVPLVIPCHRVLAANGKSGGFTAYGGVATKAKLLDLEGVTLFPRPRADSR